MGRTVTMEAKFVLSLFCVAAVLVIQAEAHGYMKDPPGRASAWRFGFRTPRNYEDDECNCGGFGNQWDKHNGLQGRIHHQHQCLHHHSTWRMVRVFYLSH